MEIKKHIFNKTRLLFVCRQSRVWLVVIRDWLLANILVHSYGKKVPYLEVLHTFGNPRK